MNRHPEIRMTHPEMPDEVVTVPRQIFDTSYSRHGWTEATSTAADSATVEPDTSPKVDDDPASKEDPT